MINRRTKLTTDLETHYATHIEDESRNHRAPGADSIRKDKRMVKRLQRLGVQTGADLLGRLPELPLKLKEFGIELIWKLELNQAFPILRDLMSDRKLRRSCALALSQLKPQRKVLQLFLRIGKRELASPDPDRYWLEAVVDALQWVGGDRQSLELLLAIFARQDLPGWLRGDAADRLGGSLKDDRRTALFRRCRDTALLGLDEDSIYVQFGSMYLLGQLASKGSRRHYTLTRGLSSALPRLRQIAAHDDRLSPGYWWPMSAEAKDVIFCFKHGHWPDIDAGDRFLGNAQRGEWERN
jgi:hypothetical protein